MGYDEYGGDSSKVKNKLINIKIIYSNDFAFVAVTNDDKIITWGSPRLGGDSSSIHDLI